MRTIVVVEDNQWLAGSYERILQSEGYSTYRTDNADDAIDLIDDHHPDVILLDVLLTRTTGMALLHELQSHGDLARIPVIVMTSIASRIKLETLRPYGVHHVLDKETITPDEMIKVIGGVFSENISH